MKNTTKKHIIAATALAVTAPAFSGALIASAQTTDKPTVTSTVVETPKDGEVKDLPTTPVENPSSPSPKPSKEEKPAPSLENTTTEKPAPSPTEENKVPNDKVAVNVPKYNVNGIPMIEPGKVQTVLPSPSYNEDSFDKTLRFSIANHKYGPYFAIDAKTGIITVTLPADYIKVSGQHKIDLPVNITQEVTGTTIQTVVTMNLGNQKQDFDAHHYNNGKPIKVLAGKTKTISPTAVSDKTPELVNAKLKDAYENVAINDKTGELTITPPKDAKPGSYKGEVDLYYKDSFMKTANFTYEIVSPDNYYTFFYTDDNEINVVPGETITLKPTFDEDAGALPEGTKYTLTKNENDYATINENTGELTIKVPGEVKVGEESAIAVTATLPDGSVITKENTVKVVTQEEKNKKEQEKKDNDTSSAPENDSTKTVNTVNNQTPTQNTTTVNNQSDESLAVTGSNVAIMLGILAAIAAIGGLGYFGYTRTRGDNEA